MVRLFRTEHRVGTDVDISCVAFWRQPFHLRDVAFGRLRAERLVATGPVRLAVMPLLDRFQHTGRLWLRNQV
jgi:hypothetical protein